MISISTLSLIIAGLAFIMANIALILVIGIMRGSHTIMQMPSFSKKTSTEDLLKAVGGELEEDVDEDGELPDEELNKIVSRMLYKMPEDSPSYLDEYPLKEEELEEGVN